MSRWYFEPVFESYMAVFAVAAVLVALLLLRPAFHTVAPRRQRILTVLRLAAILLVVLALLRPSHLRSTSQPQTAVLVILFDQSRSMGLPDAAGDRSRWEAQQAVLEQAAPLLDDIADDLEVRIYAFDETLHEAEFRDGSWAFAEVPAGDSTDIGTNLQRALRRELGKRLAGVILLSDGAQNAADPEVDVYTAARELARNGFPLFTVVFGPAGATDQSRDVVLERMPEQFTVFVKNELPIRATVRVRGYLNKEIPLTLVVEGPDGGIETIGPIAVTAEEENQQIRVDRLSYIPERPGEYRLRLIAEEQPGELVTSNNELTAFLTVLEGGLKLLYLEGEPRQEQKFLRWSLDGSPDMELDFQWFPRRWRRDWPLELEGEIEEGDYDVFLIGDLDSAALSEASWQQMAEQVEQGKGLIMLGGYHSFDPGGYRSTALRDVLPVTLDRLARQPFDGPDQVKWHVPGPLAMLPARNHPVVTLAGDPDANRAAWGELPPLTGANRFDGIKPLPGVEVLADAGEVPLLVSGTFGQGRVLAFAGDSTWQWWRQGQQDAYKRFWRQVILWLARQDDLARQDIWLEMAQRRLPAGMRAEFSTGVRSGSGDPLPNVSIEAVLVDPEGRRMPLQTATDGERETGRTEPLDEPGTWRIEAQATVAGELLTESLEFQVLDEDLELAMPAADHDQMARLATLTRDAGGAAVPPEKLNEVLQQIRDNPPQLQEEILLKWQLADTWWDAWLFFAALVGLLTAEWALRKKWGLV